MGLRPGELALLWVKRRLNTQPTRVASHGRHSGSAAGTFIAYGHASSVCSSSPSRGVFVLERERKELRSSKPPNGIGGVGALTGEDACRLEEEETAVLLGSSDGWRLLAGLALHHCGTTITARL